MVKSLKDISWNVSEDQYRNDPSLSYSILSKYERDGFHKLSSLYDKIQTSSLTFGSMVDTLITAGKEEFDKLFYISNHIDVTDKIKNIVNNIRNIFISHGDTPPERLKNVCDDEILDCANEVEYQMRWKDETRIKSIRELADEYYYVCNKAMDKIVITEDDYNDAVACVETLMNADATRNIFNPTPFDGEIEVLYQLKFKHKFNGVPYRGMMDLISVNHTKKTIQPYDLKTSSHFEDEFPLSFVTWGYSIQARLYWRLINENIKRDDYFKDFTVLPYKFIVINRNSLKPLIWNFDNTTYFGPIKFTNKNSNITCLFRDPYDIGNELWEYLTHPKDHPSYIKYGYEDSNSIDDYLMGKFI